MRQGDWAGAWAINDAVLHARDPAGRDDPALPYHRRWVWNGTPPDGRDVLVRCYHGLGDTLQFCRYLPALARRARRVTMEVQPELIPLLSQITGVALRPFDPAHPLQPAEVDIEVMELFHALRQAPDPSLYLRVLPSEVPKGAIGFCWQSGGWDRARDIPPELLRPAAGLGPAISLQRGPAAAEAPVLPATDPLHGDMSVAAMAGLLIELRAVVTVDTMVAHLAGALGVHTILLLRREADWRWGEGADVPWYRSVQALRQTTEGDWSHPLATLAATLL